MLSLQIYPQNIVITYAAKMAGGICEGGGITAFGNIMGVGTHGGLGVEILYT